MPGADSIYANPYYVATQDITPNGAAWAYAVCAVMFTTAFGIFIWHLMVPRGHRVFHQMAVILLTVAGIAYFSLGSALGRVDIQIEFSHANGFPLGTTRSIWYVRYIDWVITTPLLLLTLLLGSALPLSDIITVVMFDEIMIVGGLVGALVPSVYKFGYFAFAMAAEFYIWYVLFGPARASAGMLGSEFKSAYTKSAFILSFLWLLYPIAWGLADGGNVITSDSEMIFYGILDFFAKPVFTLFHLYSLSKCDLTHLQLSSGKYTSTSGIPADAEKVQPATAGTGNTSMPVGATGQKKGMFGRRGHYDAPAAPANVAVDSRPSNATAVSH